MIVNKAAFIRGRRLFEARRLLQEITEEDDTYLRSVSCNAGNVASSAKLHTSLNSAT